MEITEVRIKLVEDTGEKLLAFCSVIFDDSFVVRDVKIIEGSSGPFVAMPSRKLTAHCPKCRNKNHLRAAYCNQCGTQLKEFTLPKDENGRVKLFADIAHPINTGARDMIQKRIIQAYNDELERSKQPGYTPQREDFFFPDDESIQTITTPHNGHSGQPAEPHLNKQQGEASDISSENRGFAEGLFD